MPIEIIIVLLVAALLLVAARVLSGGRRPNRNDPFDTGQPVKPRQHGGAHLDKYNTRETSKSFEGPQASAAAALDPRVHDAIIMLLQRRKKLQAIKVYRQATGAGLKASKDYVEAIARANGL